MALLPGWNSIEAAAWVHDLLEKTSLFLIAILAITIGVAYLYGHRRDYLSDEATRAAAAARQAAPVEGKTELVPNPAPSPEIQNPAAANQPVIEEKNLPGAGGQTPAAKPQAPVSERQPLAEEDSRRAQDDREKRGAPQPASPKEPATGVKNAAGIDIRKSSDLGGPQARRHLSADQKARLHAFLKDQPKGRLLSRVIPSVPTLAITGSNSPDFSSTKPDGPCASTTHGSRAQISAACGLRYGAQTPFLRPPAHCTQRWLMRTFRFVRSPSDIQADPHSTKYGSLSAERRSPLPLGQAR